MNNLGINKFTSPIIEISTQACWKKLFFAAFTLTIITCLWFLPITGPFLKSIDMGIFLSLNKSLTLSQTWQQFWGILNHPVENWMNLVFMVGLNIIAVFLFKPNKSNAYIFKGKVFHPKRRIFIHILYFWLFYQLVIIGTNLIFSKGLNIHRESPTVVAPYFIRLSKALGNEGIKDYSENCFPAGHAMVAMYWFFFSNLIKIKKLYIYTLIIALLLSFSRIVSGAHWMSDIVFTFFYTKIWFYSACILKNYLKTKLKNL